MGAESLAPTGIGSRVKEGVIFFYSDWSKPTCSAVVLFALQVCQNRTPEMEVNPLKTKHICFM
jgi:hypothetical protein